MDKIRHQIIEITPESFTDPQNEQSSVEYEQDMLDTEEDDSNVVDNCYIICLFRVIYQLIFVFK